MAKRAEYVFAGDAAPLLRAAKQVQRSLGQTASVSERSAKRTQAAHNKIGSGMGSLAKRAVGAGAAFAGAYASIAGAKDAIGVTRDLAATTVALNKNLGLTVEQGSRWAAVASRRDIASKTLASTFGTLGKQIVGAKDGTEASIDAFKKLGVTQGELKKMNFDQTIGAVADGMNKLPAGADRNTVGMKLFGKSWQTLAPVLREGSKEMDKQLKLADKYGVTFKGKTIKSLKELADAQGEAQYATMGLQVAFGTQLAPMLTKGITAFSRFVGQMRDGTGAGGKFAKTAKRIWEGMKPVAEWMGRAAASIARFVDKHPEVGRLAGALLAVGIAVKTISFASQITGISRLITLAGRLKKANAGTAAGGVVPVGGKGGKGAKSKVGGVAAKLLPAVVVGDELKRQTDKAGITGGKSEQSRKNWVDKNIPGMKTLRTIGIKLGLEDPGPTWAKLRKSASAAKVKVDIAANSAKFDAAMKGIRGTKLAPKVQAILGENKDAKTKVKELVKLGIPEKRAKVIAETDAAKKRLQAVKKTLNDIPNRKNFTLTMDAHQVFDAVGRLGRSGGLDLLGRSAGRRRGGRIASRYQGGGRVPIMASGGELYVEGNRMMTVPGPDDRDGTPLMARPGAKVLTYDGQARMAAGQSMAMAMAQQAPHFADGGVVRAFSKAINTTRAKPKPGLALFEAGIVESGLRNLSHGDADSEGALQLRVGLHGRALARDPFRSALAFLRRGFTGRGGAINLDRRNRRWSAGQIAQAVQGSDFPKRYDQHQAEALRYLAKGGGNKKSITAALSGKGGIVPGAFSAAYEAAVGSTSYSPAAAALEELNRKLGDKAPKRAASTSGGSDSRYPAPVRRMLTRGAQIARKGYSYSYGGGHNSSFSGPYDCSGVVSAILHAGGALSRPMAVVQPMASALKRGAGKFVTVGIRGSSGHNAHTMIRVGNKYFESANARGKTGYRKGWSGSFNKYHPQGMSRGGVVQALHQLRGAKGRKTGPLLRKLQREMKGASPKQMFSYLKLARRQGKSAGSRAAISVIQGALGSYAGSQAAAAEATLGGQDQAAADFTNALIIGGADPESGAGQQAVVAMKAGQLGQSVGALNQLKAARSVAAKAGSKKTVKDLDGRIAALNSTILAQHAELTTMTKALTTVSDSLKEHTDATRSLASEMAASRAWATQVASTENGTFRRAVVALVSGDIAGGVVSRGFGPGSGALARL